MPCFSPLKGFKDNVSGGLVFKRSATAHFPMEVACGQCLGCRLDNSRMWAIRMVHEAAMYDDNVFLTLTYRDEDICDDEQRKRGYFLPRDGSLNKKHFQDFMKRLRKWYGRRISYFHCGEYGDENGRPHYHACVFNLCVPDLEFHKFGSQGDPIFVSDTLDRLWRYGFVYIGDVTFQSAAYCGRYCMKKITGPMSETHYMRFDQYGVCFWVQPEYCTASRRPALGKAFFDKFSSDFFPSDEVPVPGHGVLKKVPRYYTDLFAREDTGVIDDVKEMRKAFKIAHGDDYTPERLMSKYRVQKARSNMLLRSGQ